MVLILVSVLIRLCVRRYNCYCLQFQLVSCTFHENILQVNLYNDIPYKTVHPFLYTKNFSYILLYIQMRLILSFPVSIMAPWWVQALGLHPLQSIHSYPGKAIQVYCLSIAKAKADSFKCSSNAPSIGGNHFNSVDLLFRNLFVQTCAILDPIISIFLV